MKGPNGVEWYNVIIIILAVIGVFVNTCSLVVLIKKRKNSMFYKLLKLLAISDFVVVIGGALLYGLPDLWHAYSLRAYPFILPYVLPTVQIAMMISIYTTILMSFERYVRIGHTCRLKDCSYMTDDNFKYYLCAIVIAPCIFYVPKFFELYAEETRVGVDIEVNCHSVLNPPKVNLTVMKELFGVVPEDFMRKYLGDPPNPTQQPREDPFLKECQAANFTGFSDYASMKLNVTQYVETVEIKSTELRQNSWYYRIYIIGLHTLFSSAFPLLSLLYLNIYTVLALRKIGKENGVAITSRISNSASATSNRNLMRENLVAKRWKKSTYEMSFLKRKKKRSNEKHLRMRFVKETHSIEVITRNQDTAESQTRKLKKKAHFSWLRKRGIAGGSQGNSGSSDSNKSHADSQTCMRARSDSECQYSPEKRNTLKLLQRRAARNPGALSSTQAPLIVRCQKSKHDSLLPFRRRAYSAPNDFQSASDQTRKYHSSGETGQLTEVSNDISMNAILLLNESPEARNHEQPEQPEEHRFSEAANIRVSLLRSGEARLTRIALAIVWLFIFCHAWRLIPTIYEALYPNDVSNLPNWLFHVHGISHSLIVFNSAVNFLLYTVL